MLASIWACVARAAPKQVVTCLVARALQTCRGALQTGNPAGVCCKHAGVSWVAVWWQGCVANLQGALQTGRGALQTRWWQGCVVDCWGELQLGKRALQTSGLR